MALVSPGAEVKVIDESFYTPAAAGTTPMIFVASAQNKTNSSGTGTARGTLASNAGQPFLMTSQRDLAETFGDPLFQTDANNNPVHAGELNEYGLQAAYSVLGVTNRAWVTRADIDLGALEPTPFEPAGEPINGTYWLDTASSEYGIFEYQGKNAQQKYKAIDPIVITEPSETVNDNAPKVGIGNSGDYAVVFVTTVAKMFYKNSTNTWVLLGSTDWKKSRAVARGTATLSVTATTSFDIATPGSTAVTITLTADSNATEVATAINDAGIAGVTAKAEAGRLVLFTENEFVTIQNISYGDPNNDTLGLAAQTYYSATLQISRHTDVPQFKAINAAPGSVWIKTTEPGGGARWRMKVYQEGSGIWEEIDAPIYANSAEALYQLDRTGGGTSIPVGATFVMHNVADDETPLATFKVYRRKSVAPTKVTGDSVSLADDTEPQHTVKIRVTQPAESGLTDAEDIVFTAGTSGNESATAGNFVDAVNQLGITGLKADVVETNKIVLEHATGGDIRLIDDDTTAVLGNLGFSTDLDNVVYAPGTDTDTTPEELEVTLWTALNDIGDSFYTPSPNEVTSLTAHGALWYSSVVDEADIMIHDGATWRGYLEVISDADPNGPIVSASTPEKQSNGDDLVSGDLWIDTSDIENYPRIYRFDADIENTPIEDRWIELDTSDQTSEDGVLFADARYGKSGATGDTAASIKELLNSSYLDFDAPDPALYPRGMLLFNLRRSGFNVKRFVRNYVDKNQDNVRFGDESMQFYAAHRWVTESANNNDGSGSFGRKAQRKVVVQALQAMMNSNDDIRDTESRRFNLMATPGYPELIGEMIKLNYDRGLTAFIVGDTPARLKSNGTALNTWATNERLAVEDNENGLVSRDEYMSVFYPHGFTSDNADNNVVVPPSHMLLRTMVLSDQVSFPWFAPAGTRRGGVTNATSTGYVDSEGGFRSIALNEGQRDILYENAVNPVTFISGAGLVNYGQKTRSRGSSSLDRINVSRLVIFLRERLNQLAKPYIFEQNDKITRDELKQATESLLLELVGQRALYDFLVVCDESNNTPSRIDRGELYLDIAIEPVKAVEFIYIPLRLKNTGEIASS